LFFTKKQHFTFFVKQNFRKFIEFSNTENFIFKLTKKQRKFPHNLINNSLTFLFEIKGISYRLTVLINLLKKYNATQIKKNSLPILLFFWIFSSVTAQTEVSGFYPEKNALTIAPSYSYKNYDRFYSGTTLTDGNPAGLGAISSNIVNLYGEYGITDWLSSSINLPYISVRSENGEPDPVLGKINYLWSTRS